MWSTRVALVAREQRYPSDLSDAEWVVVEPLLPAPSAHPRGGRPEKHPRREIVDAILYVVRTGCAWRQLPADFPPWETVYWYFTRWKQRKLTFRMVDALRAMVREQAGRDPEPSAGLMDSQSVKGSDTVGVDTRGYDAGKKVNGRKRFIVTDTLGLLLVALVLPAGVQDRDGGKKLVLELRHRQIMGKATRRVRYLFADAGFAGAFVDWARTLRTTIEIVRKPPDRTGFAVIPRRWAVERTFAWLTAHRRLARDHERHPATSEAIIRWAAITTMTRRIARGHAATRLGPRPLTTT
ncbi:transposase [Actinokineospora auranticolor]|uniref:Transposase n=1 Tax=Actinokineospora auranticolor TaxID=155976 RepID=A0A2S6GM58_9PSEU|nr:transposase [Actinokineospora auranticolor]